MDMSIYLKSKEEINELADSGMFNSIIEGYVRAVFADLELSEELGGYSFSKLFDSVSAADARRIAVLSDEKKRNQFRFQSQSRVKCSAFSYACFSFLPGKAEPVPL